MIPNSQLQYVEATEEVLLYHPFSTHASFFEKVTFLIPWYTYVRVPIRCLHMSFPEVFRVCTKWIVPIVIIQYTLQDFLLGSLLGKKY